MFNPNCDKKYKYIKGNSYKSTKNFLVAHGIIDQYNNILNLNSFREAKTWLSSKAQNKLTVSKPLIEETNGGKSVLFNKETFTKLDKINKQARQQIFNLQEIANLPVKDQETFYKAQKDWKITNEFDTSLRIGVINDLTGFVLEDYLKKAYAQETGGFEATAITDASNSLLIKTKLEEELSKLSVDSEEYQKLKIILDPENWPKFQREILAKISQLGFTIKTNIRDVVEEDATDGKDSHEEYSTIDPKEKMSSRLRAFLSAIRSGSKSNILINGLEESYVPLNELIQAINEATKGLDSTDAMIQLLRSFTITHEKPYLNTVAEKLESERNIDSRIYNEFGAKFNQRKVSKKLIRFDYVPIKGAGGQYLKDENGEIKYNFYSDTIDLDRNDVSKNLRESWADEFLNKNGEVVDNQRIISKENKEKLITSVKEFVPEFLKNFKGLKLLDKQKAISDLKKLFNAFGIESLNEKTLDWFILPYEVEGVTQHRIITNKRGNEISSDRDASKVLNTIFYEIITNQKKFLADDYDFSKLFNTTGFRKIADREAIYVSSFINTSTLDGKNRIIWGYGLPTPETVELNKLTGNKEYLNSILKNDNFRRGSFILKEFSQISDPVLQRQFIDNLQISIFDVLKTKKSNVDGKELSESTAKEYLTTQLSLFSDVKEAEMGMQWRNMYITTPSDKSVMTLMNIPIANVEIRFDDENNTFSIFDEKVKTNIVERAYQHAISEYNKIGFYLNADSNIRKQIDWDNTYQPNIFYITPTLNNRTLEEHKENVSVFQWNGSEFKLKPLTELLHNGFTVSQHIRNSIKKQLINDVNTTYKLFEDSGIIKNNELEYINKRYLDSLKDRTKSDIKKATLQLIADYALNYSVSNTEMQMMLLGDPMTMLKTENVKLSDDYVNNRLDFSNNKNSEDFVKWLDSVRLNLSKRMAGVQASGTHLNYQGLSTSSRTIYIQDAGKIFKVDSKTIDNIEKNWGEETAKIYKKIDFADGWGVTNPLEDLYIKFRKGDISKTVYNSIKEKVIKAHEFIAEHEGESLPEELQFSSEEGLIAQAIKPVYYGLVSQESLGYSKTTYNKDSELALYPQLTINQDIDKLRQTLMSKNIDRSVMLSASKLGAKNPIKGLFENNNGTVTIKQKVLDGINEDHIDMLPRDYFSIQLEVPYDETKDSIRVGSQALQLMFSEILNETFSYNGKDVNGKELRDEHSSLYNELLDLSFEDLQKEIGATRDEYGNVSYSNLEKLQLKLLDQATKQGYSENSKYILNLTQDKQSFLCPITFSNDSRKFEKLLISMINSVIFQKMRGRSFVLSSEAGFTPTRKTKIIEGKEANDWILFNKTSIVYSKNYNPEVGLLSSRVDEETGKILPAQVMVSFKFFDNKGEKLDLLNYLYEENRHQFIDTTKISPELLKLIGFRIPTQGHPSMSAIEIVGFLPSYMADTIIAPQDFTKQFGSDFDIDKLYSYSYNSYVDGNGGLKKIIQYVPIDVKEEDVAIDRMFALIFPNDISPNETKEKIERINNERKRQYLQNQIQDVYHSVLTNKNVIGKALRGITEGFLTKLAQDPKLASKLPSLDSYTPNSVVNKYSEYFANQAGKVGIGIMSINNTFFTLAEGKNMYLTISGTEKAAYTFPIRIGENTVYLGKISQGIGHNRIMSAYQSAAVDNAKLQVLDALNVNSYTMGVISIMASLTNEKIADDYNEDYITFFISQDIIKDFIKRVNSHSVILDDFQKDLEKKTFDELKKEIQDRIDSGEINKELFDSYYDKVNKTGLSASQLRNLINYSQEKEEGIVKFTEESPQEKRDAAYWSAQLFILDKFQYLSDAAKELRSVQSSINSISKGAGESVGDIINKGEKYDKFFTWQESRYFGNLENLVKSSNGQDNFSAKATEIALSTLKLYGGNENSVPILLSASTYFKQFLNTYNTLVGSEIGNISTDTIDKINNHFTAYIYSSPELNIQNSSQNIKTLKNSLLRNISVKKDITPNLKAKMTFDYGNNKRAIINSTSTIEAIKNGERTATTRYESDGHIDYWKKAKIGDIIEFEGKNNEKVLVEVTRILHKINNSNAEDWSNLEGWSTEYFNSKVLPKINEAWQIEYKLVENTISNKNLSTQIKEFKKTETFKSSIVLQPLFNSLRFTVDESDPSIEYIEFRGQLGLTNPEDEIVASLDLLKDINYSLFEKLIQYQLLVQGFQTPVNFRKFIPNYYLESQGIFRGLRDISKNFTSWGSFQNIGDAEKQYDAFMQQMIQHIPTLATKIEIGTQGGIKDGKLVINHTNESVQGVLYKKGENIIVEIEKEDGSIEKISKPAVISMPTFVTFYDKDTGKQRLFKIEDFQESEFRYEELPTLGNRFLTEYEFNNPEPISSIIPSNNPANFKTKDVSYTYTPSRTQEVADFLFNTISISNIAQETLEKFKSLGWNENSSGNKNIENMLSHISENSDNTSFKILSQVISDVNNKLEVFKGVKLEIGDTNSYDIAANTITLSGKENIEQAFLHELLHKLTADKITDGTDSGVYYRARIEDLIKEAEKHLSKEEKDILKESRNNPEHIFTSEAMRSKVYGLSSPDEFISQIMTDKGFQEFLSKIKDSTDKSLWKRFTSIVKGLFNNFKKALGLNYDESILNTGIDLVGEIIESPESDDSRKDILFLAKVDKTIDEKANLIGQFEDRLKAVYNLIRNIAVSKNTDDEKAAKIKELRVREADIQGKIQELTEEFNSATILHTVESDLTSLVETLKKPELNITDMAYIVETVNFYDKYFDENLSQEGTVLNRDLYEWGYDTKGKFDKIRDEANNIRISLSSDFLNENSRLKFDAKAYFSPTEDVNGYKKWMIGADTSYNEYVKNLYNVLAKQKQVVKNHVNRDEHEFNKELEKFKDLDQKQLFVQTEGKDEYGNKTIKQNFLGRINDTFYNHRQSLWNKFHKEKIDRKDAYKHLKKELDKIQHFVDLRFLFPEDFNKAFSNSKISESETAKYLSNLEEFYIKQFGDVSKEYAKIRFDRAVEKAKAQYNRYKEQYEAKLASLEAIYEGENEAALQTELKDWELYNSPFHYISMNHGFKGSLQAFKNSKGDNVKFGDETPIKGGDYIQYIANRIIDDKNSGFYSESFAKFEEEQYKKNEKIENIENDEFLSEEEKKIKIEALAPTHYEFLHFIKNYQQHLLEFVPNYVRKGIRYNSQLDVKEDFFKMYSKWSWMKKAWQIRTYMRESVKQIFNNIQGEKDVDSKHLDLLNNLEKKYLKGVSFSDYLNERGIGDQKTQDVSHYFKTLRNLALDNYYMSQIETQIKLIQGTFLKENSSSINQEKFKNIIEQSNFVVDALLYGDRKNKDKKSEFSKFVKWSSVGGERPSTVKTALFAKNPELEKQRAELFNKLDNAEKDHKEKLIEIEKETNEDKKLIKLNIEKEDYSKYVEDINSQLESLKTKFSKEGLWDAFTFFLRTQLLGYNVLGRYADVGIQGLLGNYWESNRGEYFDRKNYGKALLKSAHYVPEFVSKSISTLGIPLTLIGAGTAIVGGPITGAMYGLSMIAGGEIATYISRKLNNNKYLVNNYLMELFDQSDVSHLDGEQVTEQNIYNPLRLIGTSEHLNRTITTRAFLDKQQVIDKEGKSHNLGDIFSVKNGKVVYDKELFPELDLSNSSEYVLKLQGELDRANEIVHGANAAKNPVIYHRSGLARLTAIFKTFYWEMLTNTFANTEQVSARSGKPQVGYAGVIKSLINKRNKDKTFSKENAAMFRLIALGATNLATSTIPGVNIGVAAAQIALLNYKKLGKDFANGSEAEQKALNVLSGYLTTSILMSLALSLAALARGDDDKDKWRKALNLAINLLWRTNNESASQVNPASNFQLKRGAKGLHPMFNLILSVNELHDKVIKSYESGDGMTKQELAANHLLEYTKKAKIEDIKSKLKFFNTKTTQLIIKDDKVVSKVPVKYTDALGNSHIKKPLQYEKDEKNTKYSELELVDKGKKIWSDGKFLYKEYNLYLIPIKKEDIHTLTGKQKAVTIKKDGKYFVISKKKASIVEGEDGEMTVGSPEESRIIFKGSKLSPFIRAGRVFQQYQDEIIGMPSK